MTYDVIVRNGLWFDGTGAAPRLRTLGIRDGIVARIVSEASSEPLDETGCPDVIDAAGKWIVPGFIDVHTHYDAEVLLDPGLRESVRHGVTTVLLGNCSLSTVYANSEDAADLFSRVEAVPRKFVLGALEAKKTWSTPAEYVRTLDELPLGPNVSSLLGHSDLRTAVLGLDRATTDGVNPTDAELDQMAAMLEKALDAGLLGMSGMDAAIDKLDGERFRSRALPSTFATWRERRKLIAVLRTRGRILQSAPDVKNPMSALNFFLSSSRMFGRRRGVRMSLLVSADAKSAPGAVRVFGPGTRLIKLLGSFVRFQHLPVPFELYSDGIDLPVFEEFGAGTAALHLRDQLERNELLADTEYRRRFRRSFDRIKLGPSLWHRDFHDATIVECPDKTLIGKSFGQIADERGLHPLDAFLDVLVENGERNVRWTTIVANHRPKHLDKLAADPSIHMGFSDAGAHLRNMAFYNFSLRLLKRVRDADRAGRPFLTVQRAVHRLTAEVAEWFGLDAGTLREGERADFVVIDPAGLDESVDGYHEDAVPFYGGLSRMVNRNDAAVVATGVNGTVVFRNGEFCEGYGTTVKSGRFLRADAGQTAKALA
jgi:N-acyl-D-aspartate/D-glutamate deacylase